MIWREAITGPSIASYSALWIIVYMAAPVSGCTLKCEPIVKLDWKTVSDSLQRGDMDALYGECGVHCEYDWRRP